MSTPPPSGPSQNVYPPSGPSQNVYPPPGPSQNVYPPPPDYTRVGGAHPTGMYYFLFYLKYFQKSPGINFFSEDISPFCEATDTHFF